MVSVLWAFQHLAPLPKYNNQIYFTLTIEHFLNSLKVMVLTSMEILEAAFLRK